MERIDKADNYRFSLTGLQRNVKMFDILSPREASLATSVRSTNGKIKI